LTRIDKFGYLMFFVRYIRIAIKKMIDELKLNRWTFTYIGADHDVEKFAASISTTNTIHFQKNEANMKAMFARESSSRANYSQKIREKKDTSDDFYNDDDSKK